MGGEERASGGGRFLLCPPRFYGIEYVINPWMRGNVGRVDCGRAERQWDGLYRAIEARAEIALVEPARGLPDMPFTANAGLVVDTTFIPSRFHFPQRRPETTAFVRWAHDVGLRVAELPSSASFEGEGDALFQPGEPLLWAGHGIRSSLRAYRALADLIDVEIAPLELVDERFYHLDTCFCPLPGGGVLFHPDAFACESVAAIRKRIPAGKRIEVDLEDALAFACNAISIGDALITSHASDALRRALSRFGLEVVVCELDQFLLAGGGAKCLALQLERSVPATTSRCWPQESRVR